MDLQSILLSDDVVYSICKNMDYLLQIIPEIGNMIGFEHKHPHHHLDVWNHTLLALSLSDIDFDIRLCLLLHDIGKPFSYQEGEVRHFRNHERVSSKMAKEILNRLGYDEEYIEYICYLVENHDTKIDDEKIENNYEVCLKLYKIQICDALAHHPDKLERRQVYLGQVKDKMLSKGLIKRGEYK